MAFLFFLFLLLRFSVLPGGSARVFRIPQETFVEFLGYVVGFDVGGKGVGHVEGGEVLDAVAIAEY